MSADNFDECLTCGHERGEHCTPYSGSSECCWEIPEWGAACSCKSFVVVAAPAVLEEGQ